MAGFSAPMEVNEEELRKLSHYNRIHFFKHFWEVSKEHQNLHEQYLEHAKKLYIDTEEWQCEEYYDFHDKAQKSGYIAIVFAIMYIEGAIYNFGAIYLGDSYVERNLDRLSLLSKISVILRLVTGKDIATDGQAYEHLKRLLKYRNSLVHSKSRTLPTATEFLRLQEKWSEDYYKAIESAKYAANYLDKEGRLLNKDEHHPGIFDHF